MHSSTTSIAPDQLASHSKVPEPWKADGSERDLPSWVVDLLDSTSRHAPAGHVIRHHKLIIPNAASLGPAMFTKHVRDAYTRLLGGIELERIFRIWNFIPRISDCEEDGMNRYMRFNSARYAAFETHSGGRSHPPASGVGHAGEDLVVHLLEGVRAVHLLQNPRQILPRNYSRTWGPLPPVFSRAAVAKRQGASDLFLASGTASVLGEDTAHPDDLQCQLEETFANLEALMSIAGIEDGRLDSILVYVKRPEDFNMVRSRLLQVHASKHTTIEMRIGCLCRAELLVEMEGFRILEPRLNRK